MTKLSVVTPTAPTQLQRLANDYLQAQRRDLDASIGDESAGGSEFVGATALAAEAAGWT